MFQVSVSSSLLDGFDEPEPSVAQNPKSVRWALTSDTRQLSLRHRLQLLAALALVPAFVIVAVNLVTARSLRLEELDAYAVRMSEVLQQEVIRGLTGAAVLLIAAGNAPVVAEPGAACEGYLSSFAQDLPTVIDIAAVSTSGNIYCRSGPTSLDDLEEIARSLIPLTTERHIAVGGYAETPRGASLPIGMAVRDVHGAVLRYLVITVALTELERLVSERRDVVGGHAIVADVSGTILLQYPEVEGPGAGEPLLEPYSDFSRAEAAGTTWLGEVAQDRRIVAYRPLTERVPLSFIFEIPSAGAMAPINRATLLGVALALSGALTAMALATWYGKTFIRNPVDNVLAVLAARRAGDRHARTDLVSSPSELESVGGAINDLFDELEPAPAGFGTMMLKRVLGAETRGNVELEFATDGLRFSLKAPWEHVKPAASASSEAGDAGKIGKN